MAQMQWTVISHRGERSNVGLYHGKRSGHLLVHCNGEILTIDFSILEDKQYHFFIGKELYQLEIEKTEEGFAYGLERDEESETPFNEAIKAREKKEANWYAYGALGFLILLLLLLLLFYLR